MSSRRFTTEERRTTRDRLLELAESDPNIVAAAVTGSGAVATEDEWSDIDLAFAVGDAGEVSSMITSWTAIVEDEFGVVHYWDLPADARIFRVFLLPNGLEVDVSFMPAEAFRARGPKFKLVFGTARDAIPSAQEDVRGLIGRGWHHVLHATACIARGKVWEAEWFISGARDHALSLACARLNLPTAYARGTDQLPLGTLNAYEQALVHSLDPLELQRAVTIVRKLYLEEVREFDASLARQLEMALPPLT
jgi:hypothetical protein